MTGVRPHPRDAGRLNRTWPLAFQQIRIISPFARGYGWVVPVMAALSLSASFAETLAVTLVILFLYVVIGPGAEAAGVGGLLSHFFAAANAVSGDTALGLAAIIFALVVTKSVLRVSYDLLVALLKNVITERARNAVYTQYLQLPYGDIQSRDRGDLINVLAHQSWAVADAFYVFSRIGTNAAAIMVFGGILLAVSWEITLVAAIGSAIVLGGLHLLSRPMRRLGDVALRSHEELSEQMINTLQGMRSIRAYGQEPPRLRLFRHASRRARDAFVRMDRICSIVTPISEVSYLALLAAIVWISTASNISFAATLSAVALLYRLQPHLREFEGNRLHLARLAAPLAAVDGVVGRAGERRPPDGSRVFPGLLDRIRFERVSLTYPGAEGPSLKAVDFTICKGATTAIIGPSGAGKTSVVSLLLRLYDPSAGQIVVDGTPLNAFDRVSWLARIAVAGQDAELIDNTIIENIRLAKPDATIEEIEEAARLAGILDFVRSLPDGFDSWIGTQGLNLSGGQRQRLGLARALIRRPEILILDEATNAVDGIMEADIRANISSAMAGATIIIITHRLDTVSNVGRVVRLENGRVVDDPPARSSPGPAAQRPERRRAPVTPGVPLAVRAGGR